MARCGGAVRGWAGLAVLAAGVAAFVAVSARWQGQFDLQVYHNAVSSWLHGGDLYTYRQPGTIRAFGFTYPPFAAVFMVPLALVAWPVAAALLAAASVSGTLVLLWRRLHRLLPVLAAMVLLVAAEPWRETLSLGQINLVQLTLVGVDLLFLLGRRPAAGALIGLAAGIKLTPVLFIGYLLFNRYYRASLVAGGTALFTVAVGWLAAPAASYEYWTDLLWRTDRIGDVASVSNQSLAGALHRLHAPERLWPVLVIAVLVVWAWRIRGTAVTDPWAGLALTGVAMCLVSPISWVHHLVWQLPAVLVLFDTRVVDRRRYWWGLLGLGVYGLMATMLVWLFEDPGSFGYPLGSNMHVITGLVLLLALPAHRERPKSANGGPQFREPFGVAVTPVESATGVERLEPSPYPGSAASPWRLHGER